MKAFGLFDKMKQKSYFFFEKKNSKWPSKKKVIFSSANSQYSFVKILWIGPWVSRID